MDEMHREREWTIRKAVMIPERKVDGGSHSDVAGEGNKGVEGIVPKPWSR